MEDSREFIGKEPIKEKSEVKGVSFVLIEFPRSQKVKGVLLKENSSIERNPKIPFEHKARYKHLKRFSKNIQDQILKTNRVPQSLTPQPPLLSLPESSSTSIMHDNSSIEYKNSPRHNKNFFLWKAKLNQLQLKITKTLTPRSNASISPSLLQEPKNSFDDDIILHPLKHKKPSKMPKSQCFLKRLPARYMPKIDIKKFTKVTKNKNVSKICLPISKTPIKHQASYIKKLNTLQEKLYLYNSTISNNSFL